MARIRKTIDFNGQSILDECVRHRIQANGQKQVSCIIAPGAYLDLRNSAPGSVQALQRFVLCSRTLPLKTLSQLLRVCKNKEVPLGFRINDAFFSDKVLVVGDFSDSQLDSLAEAAIDVIRIMNGTPEEIRNDLDAQLG